MQGLFVTGTDTEVGKTVIACGLMQSLRDRGLRVSAMKPVAAGCDATPEGLRNEDALGLQALCSTATAYELLNPYPLEPPIAPHLAAAQAGVRLDLDVIEGNYRRLAAQADVTVVEGAGGWRVPLGPASDMADIPRRLELPVVLVVGVRLGCLNHALLTAEAIVADGCQLAGWVANVLEPGLAGTAAQVDSLRSRLAAPLLGVVERLRPPSAVRVAQALDPAPLLEAARSNCEARATSRVF